MYDVVIVGAGSAGCALAARLSENPDRSVLLLEAGVDAAAAALDASAMIAAASGRPDNWSFASSTTGVVRGKAIGGSSVINGGLFVRATVDDCTSWAASGNTLWSYDELLPYWQRMETDAEFGDRPGHGSSGPMPVQRRRPEELHPFSVAFVESCHDLGWPTHDMNAAGASGAGRLPLNVVGGRRVSAADAYLTPIADRPNVAVRGGCIVRGVTITGGRARSVEYEQAGALRRVEGSEVVLCAGAIKSAHLLLLSGVGPASQLRSVGVAVVVDAPGVGARFSDHAQMFVEADPIVDVAVHPVLAEVGLNLALGGGAAVNLIPYVNPMGAMIPGSGASSRSLTLGAVVCGLRSRGVLQLVSDDPHVQPLIDHRYNTEAGDAEITQAARNMAIDHLRAAPMRALFGANPAHSIEYGTAMHMCSTAPMGPDSDAMAVVDQYCRVRGVDNLRVIDTSILPSAPSRGPAATAILIGERASAFFDLP